MCGIRGRKIAQACLAAGLLLGFFFLPGSTALAFDPDMVKQGVVRVVSDKGHGTGFIINENGYIVTNHHVIEAVFRGGELNVVPAGSSTLYSAEVIHADPSRDLAVLRASGLELPPLSLSRAEPKVAQEVWSAGFPGAADQLNPQNSVTILKGIISAIHFGSWGGDERFSIIQHGASVGPGNSGGPLLDSCNRVVGVNTAASLIAVKEELTEEDRKKGKIARTVRVPHGSGIFWSSAIEETIRMLDQLSVSFRAEDNECIAPVVGAEELEELREELRRQQQEFEDLMNVLREESDVEREEREREMRERQREMREWQEQRDKEIHERLRKERLRTALLLFTGVLALTIALVLSLKSMRRKVFALVKELGQSLQVREGKERSWFSRRSKSPKRGLVVSGFDGNGNSIHIVLSLDRFADQRLGVSLGRNPSLVDEAINDPSMSSRHLRISSPRAGKFYVEDLNSRNGTVLDGRKLRLFRAERCSYNSRIVAGDVELTLSSR